MYKCVGVCVYTYNVYMHVLDVLCVCKYMHYISERWIMYYISERWIVDSRALNRNFKLSNVVAGRLHK